MFRVALVNPPFAALSAPSFAVTQLQELLRQRFGTERAEVSAHYLNIDFAKYLGYDLYTFIANTVDALNCGVGEWMFRRVAFPTAEDNAQEYFARYAHLLRRADGKSRAQEIMNKLPGMDALLDSMIDEHDLAGADLVGLTSMFAQNMPSFALARKLKERNPNILTVMGGANCESPMGEEIAKNVAAVDYVFSGPALVSFPQFVEYAMSGDLARCEEIDGVIPNPARVARRPATSLPVLGQTTPAAAKKSPYGKDLDIDTKIEMDYGPFLDTVTRAFPGQVKPILFFETSRGCWWGQKAHCTFCGLNGTSMAYRAMNSGLAVEQFNSLFKHSDTVSELHCVDNIMPREYLKEVLPLLDTPPNMEIFYEVKADLTEEDIRTLARAHVRKIQPGIEALATSTLKLMKKGTTAHGNVRFLMHCALHDVEPMWNLLVGFPGEEEDVFRKYVADIPRLVHLPPPSGVFPVRFDRYSPYFVRAEEYGLQLKPLEFYELVYPFPEESIAQMAYFFSDENVFAEYAMAVGMWITKMRQGVHAWRARWGSGEPPVLRFDVEDPTVVIDTRTGELVKHDIGVGGRAVLDCLSRPRTLAEVTRLLADLDIDVEAVVRDADARGLIFEEKGRLGNLVLPSVAEGQENETAHIVESSRFAPERSLAGVI